MMKIRVETREIQKKIININNQQRQKLDLSKTNRIDKPVANMIRKMGKGK